jgi:hypothetical protein
MLGGITCRDSLDGHYMEILTRPHGSGARN